jgi:enoyl-CoA hydratase/carnithine racemase
VIRLDGRSGCYHRSGEVHAYKIVPINAEALLSTQKAAHRPPTLPDSLQTEREGDIAVLRLSRVEKRNALNDATVMGLAAFFSSIPDDVRVVVLRGEGEHFCAGLDLAEIQERSAAEGVMHSRMWHDAFGRIQFGTVPVVAVLHGAVVGGGLELACAAHIRVAEPSTFYALPEAQRGIFVGGGGSVRLPRLIGAHRMADMMLTGRVYSAEEGHQAGLSHYLTGPGEGVKTAMDLARKVAANARITNFAVIHALPRIAESGQDQGLFMEALIAGIAQSESDAKQRIKSFLEKGTGKVTRSS